MNSKRNKLFNSHYDLYRILDFGRKNAKQLGYLSSVLGIGERNIRQMIEDLTVNGYVVCNLQNGKGYYKPETDEDFQAMLKLNASRAYSLLRKDYAIKKAFEKFKYNGNSLFARN